MAQNNNLLFNAALTGYMAGQCAGQFITDAVQVDYSAQVAEAVAWAQEIDSLIATDTAGAPQPATTTGISIAGGAAINANTSTVAVQESQQVKTAVMSSLSYSVAFQRWKTGDVAASFAIPAAAVRVAYFQAVLSAVL